MKLKYCTNCLMPEIRPRISFNERGVCNACQWAEAKKTKIDWGARQKKLRELCDRFRITDGSNWDIIVPCSGGKDGSYIAWKMKHEYGMHPLCITLKPYIQTEVGRKNLDNFIKSGFDHLLISPNPVYAGLAKKGFIEQGRPMLSFTVGCSTTIIRLAISLKIPFIMYGEEGESEYGGVMTQAYEPKISRDYLVNYYYSGHDTSEYLDEFKQEDLKWWTLPSQEEMDKIDLYPTHWSHFENWDSHKHYLLAKEKCGLQAGKESSVATYTDYAQLDDYQFDLHLYLMYLKFGFGRTSADVSIDIRRGAMDRKQAVLLARKYDGIYPKQFINKYLDYFKMTKEEFDAILDKWANKDLFKKNKKIGIWPT